MKMTHRSTFNLLVCDATHDENDTTFSVLGPHATSVAEHVVVGAMMMTNSGSGDFDNPSHMFCKEIRSSLSVTDAILATGSKSTVNLATDGVVS